MQAARVRHRNLEHSLDSSGARRHHDHTIGERDGFIDRVRNEDDCHAIGYPQRLEIKPQLLPRQRVERAKRFVHEQHGRPVKERTGNGGPLLHPSRQFERIAVVKIFQADRGEEQSRTLAVFRRIKATQFGLQHDVAKGRAPIDKRRLLKDDADICPGWSTSMPSI